MGFRRIIRPPGADACLVAGVKPGTLSPPKVPRHYGPREKIPRPPQNYPGLPALPSSPKTHREAATSELCPLAERLMVREGEGATVEQLSAFFQAIAPVVDYVTFTGQRWKDPDKLSVNTGVTRAQRIYVFTHVIYPHILGFKTHVELGEALGVGRSMIMRHMKDLNVAFGVYATNQKRVSHHAAFLGAEGTYVEAARRGHETRKRNKAEREAAAAVENRGE